MAMTVAIIWLGPVVGMTPAANSPVSIVAANASQPSLVWRPGLCVVLTTVVSVLDVAPFGTISVTVVVEVVTLGVGSLTATATGSGVTVAIASAMVSVLSFESHQTFFV